MRYGARVSDDAASPAESPPRSAWRRRVRGWARDLAIVAALWFAITAWQRRHHLGGDDPAPPFALRDLEGRTTSLESLRGKRVLLHFWATWCTVCRQEFGSLEAIHRDLSADEALVSVVADSEDVEALRRFVTEHGITYPVLLATDEVIRDYRVSAFPTNYFVTADGLIDASTTGLSTRWSMGARLSCAR